MAGVRALCRAVCVLAALGLTGRTALSQTVTTSAALVPGDTIIALNRARGVRSGEFVRFTLDTLILAHHTVRRGSPITTTDTLRLHLATLDSIIVRRPRKRTGTLGAAGEGFLVGGVVGVLAGGLAGGGIGSRSGDIGTNDGVRRGVLWGAGLGSVVGLVHGVVAQQPRRSDLAWQRVHWKIASAPSGD